MQRLHTSSAPYFWSHIHATYMYARPLLHHSGRDKDTIRNLRFLIYPPSPLLVCVGISCVVTSCWPMYTSLHVYVHDVCVYMYVCMCACKSPFFSLFLSFKGGYIRNRRFFIAFLSFLLYLMRTQEAP